jgi:H+/Cl- antiporter ClcA
LIRLAVPRVPPEDLIHVLGTVVVVGAVSGAVASLTGAAIYRARAWTAPPATRLIIGGLAAGATAIALTIVASPAAAIGPGSGAVAWSDTTETAWTALIAVALLRAVATTAAVAAGGCGGVFVPFLAIGDVSGRAFAPALGISGDLAGAAGAAGGIAGGYRLPWTAVAMVVGVGGPSAATLTCLATVGVAAFSGVGTGLALDRLTARRAVPEPAAA